MTTVKDEIVLMKRDIEDMQSDVKDIKADLSEMKAKLLDPEYGVIVRVNKNTAFRKDTEDLVDEIQSLKRWRANAVRVAWTFISATIAALVKLLFFNT
jgi:predicted  nucleic acid-binding Zn-ribbon protein